MRRTLIGCVVALTLTPVAWGQRKPSVPPEAVSESAKLTGERRIRYLLRQIDLTEEQRAQAQALIASLLDQEAGPQIAIEEVYSLMAEAEQAKKDGDKEREQQIAEQLRALGRGADKESEFFLNMEPLLTPGQKAALQAARERLKRNPSGALRPVDVIRTVLALDLTREQQARIAEVSRKLREDMRRTRSLNDEQRFQIMNGLLESVRAVLNPEQLRRFNVAVRRLRPDLTRLRVGQAETQPADEETAPEEEASEQPSGE